MKKKYYLYTWDTDRQDWTAQKGVRCGPYSRWGLREPARKLRSMGYEAHYPDDFSTLVLDCTLAEYKRRKAAFNAVGKYMMAAMACT